MDPKAMGPGMPPAGRESGPSVWAAHMHQPCKTQGACRKASGSAATVTKQTHPATSVPRAIRYPKYTEFQDLRVQHVF